MLSAKIKNDCNIKLKINKHIFHDVYETNDNNIVKIQNYEVSEHDKIKIYDSSETVLSLYSTILLESFILMMLNEKLKRGFSTHPEYGEHFVKLIDVHICNNVAYMELEKINGKDYSELLYEMDTNIKNEILFQITIVLKYMQENFEFNHNDLIGRNIMLVENPYKRDWIYEINVNGRRQKFILRNPKYLVKLIDFEMSRCSIDNIIFCSERNRSRFYNDKNNVLFNTSADFCKLFNNPNINSHLTSNPDFIKLFGIEKCKNSGRPYFSVIPPYSDLNADKILDSSIFEQFKI